MHAGSIHSALCNVQAVTCKKRQCCHFIGSKLHSKQKAHHCCYA